jgi:hypothetical protein
MSAKVREYLKTNPKEKPAKIAETLGVKVDLVYAVKKYDKDRATRHKRNGKRMAVGKTPAMYNKLTELLQRPDTIPAVKVEPKAVVSMVNHPPHYMVGGIETIKFIEAKLTREEFVGYLKGNVLKYGSRIGSKGAAVLDAGKLAWYADKLHEVLSTSP